MDQVPCTTSSAPCTVLPAVYHLTYRLLCSTLGSEGAVKQVLRYGAQGLVQLRVLCRKLETLQVWGAWCFRRRHQRHRLRRSPPLLLGIPSEPASAGGTRDPCRAVLACGRCHTTRHSTKGH